MRYADKLSDAPLITAESGELIAHHRIDYPLHGSEYQSRSIALWCDHGRQGNDIPDFLTVGVTSGAGLCRLPHPDDCRTSFTVGVLS